MNKLLLLVVISLSRFGFAGDPKASNYEVDFRVSNSMRVDALTYMLVLEDGAKTYHVVCNNRNHMHGCRTFNPGEHVRGHVIEQNQTKLFSNAGTWVDLFWIDEKGKPKHQEWTVNAMYAPSPSGIPASNSNGSSAQVSSTAEVGISSTPPGADIEVDGKFVGSTPSAIGVTPGEHEIAVKKSGFTVWKRKVEVSSGHISINADLVPEGK